MSRDWYLANGFEVSNLIADAAIQRAEADVTDAYVTPIVGTAQVATEVRERAVGNLAFLLLLQRTIFATRAGAKIKTGYNSQEADAWAKLQQEATSCHLALEVLKSQPGVNPDAKVTDICKIYFSTNFINL